MLVIDDSKLKLLKMKEKMLDLAINDNTTLDEYKTLAIQIDSECYEMIINKVKDNNYNNLPFEEQIKFFNEIIEDYDYLNELQCRFKKVYAKYSEEELELSDLSNIMIEDVRVKASQIEGYLVNIKNLKSNKMELDRLNQTLLKATDEQKKLNDLMLEIRRKLKNDVLNAKGRVEGINGALGITSINMELKHYDIDLTVIADDVSLIDEAYGASKKELEEANETLNVALSLPNRDDTICNMYMQNLLSANYKFNLLELVKEVFTNTDNYDLFKDSLYKIVDLIKEIKNGLRELGVKFYINPFDYIKIKDYLAMFENVRNPKEEIENTKKTIAYLANMIDDMEKANNNFLSTVSDSITIVKKDAVSQTLYMDITTAEDNDDKSITEILKRDDAKNNQVIAVSEMSELFNRGRVREKTRGVINRVNAMLMPKVNELTVPELIIEKKEESKEAKAELEDEVVDLFQEVKPFEEPVLFENRSDSEIFSDKKAEEEPQLKKEPKIEASLEQAIDAMAMPEMFWVSKEEEKDEKHIRR